MRPEHRGRPVGRRRLRLLPRASARRAVAIAGLPIVAAISLAGCWGAGLAPPPVPTGETPAPSVSAAMAATRAQLVGTLQAAGISLVDAETPYRPAESPALAAAPRTVLRAILPDEADQGRIVIYDLGDPQKAYQAGREMAAYLGTGPGRIQFAPDARFALRLVGPTVVFSTWSAAGAADPAAGSRLMTLLQSVGITIPIPQS